MSAPAAAPSQLRLQEVHKRFGGVHALRGAELTIRRPGTVHGLIGANGSGKSTLLSILSGQLQPDAGAIVLDGKEIAFGAPAAAVARGIVMVSQETALAPDLSVAENIFLGGRMARRRLRGVQWATTRAQAVEALARLELDYDPSLPVRRLRPDQQQMVEIARALSLDARILILDEPTSSLTDDETGALFRAISSLRSQSVSTLFVSHRLDELLDLCDELTILRDGRSVDAGPIEDFDAHRIVGAMIGGTGTGTGARTSRSPGTSGAGPALRVRGLSASGLVHDVDVDVHPGEIVGLAGMVGAGRGELLEALFGVRALTGGTIEVASQKFEPGDPREAIARGLGYLPPDRKTQGLVAQRSVAENLTMVATHTRGRLRAPSTSPDSKMVGEAVAALGIRSESPDVPVATLSGGNQQKVALGKWILAGSRIMLLDQPTRGVDVAAKAEIHTLLRKSAAEGAAILVSSAETGELLDLCDRVLVLFRGRLVASLTAAETSEDAVAHLAGGRT
jgi:ABC-type sugar transport system ATPase subunit